MYFDRRKRCAFLLTKTVKMLTTHPNTTNKVQILRNKNTDLEVCEIIGISKPTLYKRLRLHNWKKSEIVLIKNLK